MSAASNMGDLPRYVVPPEGLFEGNCCYRRTALASIGNYPTELGRVGTTLLSGENAMNFLLIQKGWRLYFDPAAIIHHTIHADRLNPMWLRKRMFWQGVSGYAMHLYYRRHGLDTMDEIKIDLPLTAQDWAFINKDTAENINQSLMHFESLGFVLAMTGIIGLEQK